MKFPLDFVHQKLLRSVNFSSRYSKYKKWALFETMYILLPRDGEIKFFVVQESRLRVTANSVENLKIIMYYK